MWNLEKWYTRTSLQGGNRDTDVENTVWTPSGERGPGVGDELGNWD